MRAAVLAGPNRLEVVQRPDPIPGEGEIVLAVGANTICGTDVRILRGEKTAGVAPGVVLGHEIAGRVELIGAGVTGFAEGDMVGLMPTVPCGRCDQCRRGAENLCADAPLFGYALDGGLAERVLVPRAAMERGGVFKADRDADPAHVALAEPLGCVLNGARNYRPGVGDTVLILGAGPIGLLHTQVVRLAGASQVVVSDPSQDRVALAGRLGATHQVSGGDPVEAVADLTGGRGADVVVVCVGAPGLANMALRAAAKGGRVSLFAGFAKGASAQIDPNLIHYREIEVVGASNSRRVDHERALRLIGERRIDVGALHTDTFGLSDAVAAIEHAASGRGIKVAVVPD